MRRLNYKKLAMILGLSGVLLFSLGSILYKSVGGYVANKGTEIYGEDTENNEDTQV